MDAIVSVVIQSMQVLKQSQCCVMAINGSTQFETQITKWLLSSNVYFMFNTQYMSLFVHMCKCVDDGRSMRQCM